MDFMGKFTISVSMLLTGFVIVFAVLFFLIFIIWGYGKLISTAQTRFTERKNKKELEKITKNEPESFKPVNIAVAETKQPDVIDEGIPEEIIAVISAAVYSVYGSESKVRIKSVKRSDKRSAWSRAGVIENTRPF